MIEDRSHIKDEELEEAADILHSGGLMVFPAEAVYGLGGNALDEDAARKIYAAKGRPSDNPFIAHTSCMEEVAPLVEEIPEVGRELVEAFWPDPLTMILPKSDKIPYGTTGSLDTVAVRMSDDPAANRLTAPAEVLVAAPNASTPGRPNPTTASHVWQDMNGRIRMIIDGGPVGIGVESTIVDASFVIPVVLRPGAIIMEVFEVVLRDVSVDPAIPDPFSANVRPRAPGVKYKHYASKADPILVEPEDADRENGLDEKQLQTMIGKAQELSREKIEAGCKAEAIYTDESKHYYTDGTVRSIGERKSQTSVAHNLYALLGEFDGLGMDYTFSESFPKDHLEQAIMNRLSKTVEYKIMKV